VKKEVISKLTEKFTGKDIKQRDGGFGKKLDYIEGHKVISRLNEAFTHNWSFNILTREILNDHAVVHVQISVPDDEGRTIIKDGIGGKKLAKKRGSNEYLDVGNDIKAATTDALKVAARLFGVGLHLYDGDDTSNSATEAPEEKTDPNAPITDPQKAAIPKIADMKGVKLQSILTKYKVKSVDELKEAQAREIIRKLNEK